MSLFKSYGETSGQYLSYDKCRFYAFNFSSARIASVSNTLGFVARDFPFNYLGVPLFRGKPKKRHLQPIADRILNKLTSWKGSLLSIMGRVQLVKSIIHGIALYSFQVCSWPISLLKKLDNCIRNFIWSGDVLVKKVVTVAWKTLCSPFNEKGLGLRSLNTLMKQLC